MALPVAAGAPTVLIRRPAFGRAGLTRGQLDEWLNLTADELRLEQELIVVGPIQAPEDLPSLIDELEGHLPQVLR